GDAGKKGLVFVDLRPRALVDPEVMQASAAKRRFVRLQLLVKLNISTPELLKEDVIHNAGTFNELDQRFLVSVGNLAAVDLQPRRRKSRSHLLEFFQSGSASGLRSQ